jgi:hypothetical protein
MYDTAFNKIERELRNEEGVANELDYVEQTSWVLFLKYLHDLEAERRNRAELDGTDYSPILAGPYAWEQWAAPKTDEQFDHNKARIGEDLIQFVNTELFPYLASFRQSASGPLRLIRAMIEFKQIIGRGTRAYEGKDFFSIWDFVQGHQNFNDPEWDGDPIDPAPPRSRGRLYGAPMRLMRPEPQKGATMRNQRKRSGSSWRMVKPARSSSSRQQPIGAPTAKRFRRKSS